MNNRIYELHKRIMKHDVQAIDDIKTLEEAKEVIKMIVGNQLLHNVSIVHATHAATTAEEMWERLGL